MDEEKLIDLVRQHDLLYDPDNRDYTNKRKKEQVWDDIGRQLKRSGENFLMYTYEEKLLISFDLMNAIVGIG